VREYMTTPDGVDSDIRSGRTMIDIVDALDLLNGCVRERGESWLPAREESSLSASLGYEAGRAVMDGIAVGHWQTPVRRLRRADGSCIAL
jgi:hypothetical protein